MAWDKLQPKTSTKLSLAPGVIQANNEAIDVLFGTALAAADPLTATIEEINSICDGQPSYTVSSSGAVTLPGGYTTTVMTHSVGAVSAGDVIMADFYVHAYKGPSPGWDGYDIYSAGTCTAVIPQGGTKKTNYRKLSSYYDERISSLFFVTVSGTLSIVARCQVIDGSDVAVASGGARLSSTFLKKIP